MALTLITGPKKSGKTVYILNELKKTRDGAIIIVPEQNLFYYEKKILEILGESGAFLTETISFRKLALKLAESNDRFGILKLLDNETKNMLIASVVLKNKSRLKLYRSSGKTDYITAVSNQISEFKRHLVTLQMLNNIMEDSDISASLKDKLSDLAVILKEYDEVSEKVMSTDGDDLLTAASSLINESDYFKGKKVYIDGFTGFTAQELMLIQSIHNNGADVFISLDYVEEFANLIGDIYYSVGITKNKLKKTFDISKEIKINTITHENNEARHLISNMFTEKNKYPEKPSCISCHIYKTPRFEAQYAANYIASEIEKGASPGDFQIVAGDFEGSLPYLCEAFDEFNIPYYAENKTPVSKLSVYAVIESICNLLLNPVSAEPALNYLKSICGNSSKSEKAFVFEKFIRTSGIKGYILTGNGGFEKIVENSYNFPHENESEIKDIYDSYFAPVVKLKKKISSKNSAANYAAALFSFLKEIKLENIIRETAAEFEKDGDTDAAFRYVQVYNAIIETLEKSCLILDEEELEFREFKNIVLENLSNKSISGIPLGYDNVFITGLHGISPDVFKYVYIINANEGILTGISNEGIINEDDRKFMKSRGIELSLSPEAKITEEYLKLFTVVSSFKSKLIISRSLFGNDGEEKIPSDIYDYLFEIFPGLNENTVYEEIYSERALLNSGLKELWGENKTAAAKKLGTAAEYSDKDNKAANLIRSINLPPKTSIYIPETAEYLPGELSASVTALEKYRSCGYAYFIKYILKGKETEVYTVNTADIGLLIHHVLEKFSDKLVKDGMDFSGINDEYTEKTLKPIIKKAVSEVNNGIFSSGGRAAFIAKRVNRSVKRTLKLIKEHFTKGVFKEYGFEVTFGKKDSTLPGLEIELDNNRKVILNGTIDRVDTLKTDDGEYIRIVDYKSSGKTLDLYEIYYGLSLQLITYLMVMLESKINDKLMPGGVLYLSLENPLISFTERPDKDTIEASIRKKLVMQGILLKNEDIINAMDSEFASTGNSEIINISLDKEKALTSKSNLTLSEFQLVFEKMISNIRSEAESIYNGHFHIKPVSKIGKSSCAYCPYGAICGFDEKLCKAEEISSVPPEEILEKLKEGE